MRVFTGMPLLQRRAAARRSLAMMPRHVRQACARVCRCLRGIERQRTPERVKFRSMPRGDGRRKRVVAAARHAANTVGTCSFMPLYEEMSVLPPRCHMAGTPEAQAQIRVAKQNALI